MPSHPFPSLLIPSHLNLPYPKPTPNPFNSALILPSSLFLNVFAPPAFNTSSLPVVVYIHGGGGSVGASNDPVYDLRLTTPRLHDGARFIAGINGARAQVVIVTLNYRLGVLGFLGGSDVAAQTSDGSMGNFGILDQRQALIWVKDHIASFGGNPNDVTIWGESTGAVSVSTHVCAHRSRGLFQKARMDSDGFASFAAFLWPQTAQAHDYLLLTTYYLLLTTYYLLLTTYYLLLTTYCLLLTAHCSLLTAYCLLLIAYYLLRTAYCLLLTAYCLLLTACYLLLATCYLLLATRSLPLATYSLLLILIGAV